MADRKDTKKKTVVRRKNLPHDTNAEKAVIGAALTSKDLCDEACLMLEVEDFFEENQNHQLIFSAIKKLNKAGTPVDIQTVCDELINMNAIDLSGGADYLFELANNFVGYENAKHCLSLVYDQALLRKYLKTINKIEEKYYNSEIENISDFISDSEKELQDVSKRRSIAEFEHAEVITERLEAKMESMKRADEEHNIGVTTGFADLNFLIHGFQPGQFVILAARPGVGKTAFGLNMCRLAAIKGYPVAYFSLEMSAESLMTRIVSTEAGVSQDAITLGIADKNQRLAIHQACERVAQLPLYIDDTAGIRVADLMAKTRKLKKDVPNLGLVVVDYIGLVRVSDKTSSNDSRQMIIQETSQELKRLALELGICILCVAQLNRNVEQRENGTPMVSDLRESGSLEQDADVVLLMYSESIRKTKKFGRKDGGDELTEDSKSSALQTQLSKLGPDTQLVNVDVGKNRAGKTGTVYLFFKKDTGGFIEPDKEFIRQYKQIKAGIIPSKEE
ncbi:MAG: replicative DNA helicase [Bacilli bacterium]|nr:replicative DNA helicase [Bacilli bacterium]